MNTATEKNLKTPPPPTDAHPAVEEIFREYGPRVYSLARRLLSNATDAEDVTQDVLLHVLRKGDSFRGEAAFPTWLYRVTINTALGYRRKRALREDRRIRDPLENFLEDGKHRAPVRHWIPEPERLAIEHETHRLIEEAIAGLPETYRDVYVLADVEELHNAEIAEMLGLSEAAVKSRLHRARLMMRDALAPHLEEKVA